MPEKSKVAIFVPDCYSGCCGHPIELNGPVDKAHDADPATVEENFLGDRVDGPGLWIWEGVWMEDDGEFRRPTEEEWQNFKETGFLWP